MEIEKVKKALQAHQALRSDGRNDCHKCPFYGFTADKCFTFMAQEALQIIESLQAETDRLMQSLKEQDDAALSEVTKSHAQIRALKAEITALRQNSVSMEVYQQVCGERDAAVEQMRGDCGFCANWKACDPIVNAGEKKANGKCTEWQWRGTQKEG